MDQLLELVRTYLNNNTRDLLVFALILGRIMPMLVLTPFLGGKMTPTEIKMGMGLLFTILVWSFANKQMTAEIEIGPVQFLLMMMAQIFIGFEIGFVSSQVFYAMEMAGRLIDTVRGASMSEVMVPTSGTRATPFGDMYVQLMVIIFIAAGGHHLFIESFFYSFAEIPLNVGLMFGAGFTGFVEFIMHMSGEILLIGTVLAAPIIAATFITDLVFGILNRVAPQLNAYFLAMPVKAMAGIILVLLAMEPFIARLRGFSLWTLQAAEKTISFLSAAQN